MNPLYQQMMPQDNFVQNLMQFSQQFHGDPREQIQQLMNSGKITQQQYNNAVQLTNGMYQRIKPLLKMMNL